MNKIHFQTLVEHGTSTMVQWLESKLLMKEVQGSNLASFIGYMVANFLKKQLMLLENFWVEKILILKKIKK